jgi:hypothetical protein
VVNSHPLLPVELPGNINFKSVYYLDQNSYSCNLVVNPARGGIPLKAGLSYRGITIIFKISDFRFYLPTAGRYFLSLIKIQNPQLNLVSEILFLFNQSTKKIQ